MKSMASETTIVDVKEKGKENGIEIEDFINDQIRILIELMRTITTQRRSVPLILTIIML